MIGKVCMLTGATSGLGRATASALARQGATVVLVGRNAERCEAAVRRMRAETGNPAVDWLTADLSSQAEIRRLARSFLARFDRLDVLVNNAGGIFLRRRQSSDGIEMTFALNHLGYFLLTNLLLDVLRMSAPARVINVASCGHALCPGMNFEDLQSRKRYRGMQAYYQSKLGNILFTYELERRLEGTGVTANAVDPGLVDTNIGTNNGWIWRPLKAVIDAIYRFTYLTPEEGSRTIVELATSPGMDGMTGCYFTQGQLAESSQPSRDPAVASRLWEISAKLTNWDGADRVTAGQRDHAASHL
jgi:NAD(P)-dependent dehydrogenase (short-subunit alcohol dehydrogenase family)